MTKLFGRSYKSLGESGSDLILKTRGQVKILWGNKFIDLIKDGKINAGESTKFSDVDTEDDINPYTNGIYHVKEDDSLWVVIGRNKINLKGEIGNTYVSFLGILEVTSEQKHLALTNIGFIYPTLDEAKLANLTSGIVYIEDEQKLYVVLNGVLTEYLVNIPNPYTELFVIAKEDVSSTGALIIQGTGESNSLIVGNLSIFTEGNNNHIRSNLGAILIEANQSTVITINDTVTIDRDTTFNEDVNGNMFMSKGANASSGFRLYLDDGSSTLEVDNLIVRNDTSKIKVIYPKYWSSDYNNVVLSIALYDTDLTDENVFEVVLLYENTYLEGDILIAYVPVLVTDWELAKLQLTVQALYTEGDSRIYVTIDNQDELSLLEGVDMNDFLGNAVGLITFLLQRKGEKIENLRYSPKNIDLLEIEKLEDDEDNSKIHTRIGNLQDLEKTINVLQTNSSGSVNVDITPDVTNNKQGIYSDKLITDKSELFNANLYAPIFKGGPNKNIFPTYEEGLTLDIEDKSLIVVTSEWVDRKMKNAIPAGLVAIWNGSDIPEGWVVCDGTNGTPDYSSLIPDTATVSVTFIMKVDL